jgi:uncharacterized membrane protein
VPGGGLDAPGGACYFWLVPSASPYDSISPEDVERGRVLAAVAYLPGLCFLGLLGAPENAFIGFHARQGFLLLAVEVALVVFFSIYDGTLGRIPYLGPLVGWIVKFLVWTAALLVTAFAVAKAANGETTRLPYLGDYVERVPF